MNPLNISFVVPVYNVEKYLRQCVNSLLDQTVPACEIILVDDGSTDGSGMICDEYAEKYDTVKAVHKENAGLGMARNTGLDHVTGDYVIFIDSDDFCQPDFIAHMEDVLRDTGCDTCKTSFRKVDMEGNFLYEDTIEPGTFHGDAVRKEFLPRIIGSAPEKKDSVPASACCTLYSMKIIRDNHLRFVSERQWISEDIIFNIYYYTAAEHVVLDSYVGYSYRTNLHSLTTTYVANRLERCLDFADEENRIFRELGLYDQCHHRATRQLFVNLRLCFSTLQRSSLTPAEKKAELKKMCTEPRLQEYIRDFPVRKMGIQQQAFIFFVRHRWILPLYLVFGR